MYITVFLLNVLEAVSFLIIIHKLLAENFNRASVCGDLDVAVAYIAAIMIMLLTIFFEGCCNSVCVCGLLNHGSSRCPLHLGLLPLGQALLPDFVHV